MERIPASEIEELLAAPFLADEDFLAEDSLEDVVMLKNISQEVDLLAGQIPVSARYQKLKMPFWLAKHLQSPKAFVYTITNPEYYQS